MNDKQTRVLWIGIIVVVVMGLFPPIAGSYSLNGLNRLHFHPEPGYGLLLTSSSAKFTGDLLWQDAKFVRNNNRRKWVGVIDFQKLLIQWFIIAAITAGVIVSNKNAEAKPKE